METKIGYLLGFVVAFLVLMFMVYYFRKKSGVDVLKYDERQEVIRGRGFKYGYFVIITYIILYGITDLVTGYKWCDTFTGCLIGLCLSITVFAIYAIFKDAYLSLKEKSTYNITIFVMLGILNLVIGFVNLINENNVFVNGKLTYHSVNFILSGVFFITFIALIIKIVTDKREVKADSI